MISRELDLFKILGRKTSAFLFGARGTGKTVIAQEWLKSIDSSFSVNLLEPEYYQRYLRDPAQFRADIEGLIKNSKDTLTVFVDEVQRIPVLLDIVHQLHTGYSGKVRFLLTGSSARKLRRGGANMLAGRLIALSLFPLTYREFPRDIGKTLRFGSLPCAALAEHEPERVLKAYVNTYLREEVLEESLVRKIDSFSRFLEIAGQYHGKVINATGIGKPLRLSYHTVQEYFQILEDTYIGFKLRGWHAPARKQLLTGYKFFLFDNGVANALRGELLLEITERTSRFGELFEAMVIQEFFRWNEYAQRDFKMSFWQNSAGHEIDLILSRGSGEPLAAIEIKSDTKPDLSKCRGFKAFAAEYPQVPRYCFCRTPVPYQDTSEIMVLPWTDFDLLQTL